MWLALVGTLMKARTVYASLLIAAAGLAAVACASKKPPPKEPQPEVIVDAGPDDADAEPPKPLSLYERLGKQEGIAQFVDTFLKNLTADTKFNKRIAGVKGPKLDKLKKDLVDQICVESGGPEAGAECKYEGRFMKEALGAKGKLKEEEWTAMLLDLRTALEEHKIGDNEQQDLASALGKFRDDAVDVKAPKPAGKK
jgi:truncated hemoglobin YjbI